MNSLKFRTKGAALATACDWLFNYVSGTRKEKAPRVILTAMHQVVVQTTPLGIHHLKWGLYLIYALFNAAWVPLVYYLVVETRGRSLEETDRWFENNPDWLVHKADHSVAGGMNGTVGNRLDGLGVADDHEAMMRAFEVSAEDDDDVSSLDSPVTRRSSYPNDE